MNSSSWTQVAVGIGVAPPEKLDFMELRLSGAASRMRNRQTISPGAVHVWLLRGDLVPDAEQVQLEVLLSATERERYDRFGHAGARREYLLARVLARSVLGTYSGVAPADVDFTADAFGKPLLKSPI